MLDNPIWNALTTEQVQFAERHGDAARFQPEVTALAALRVQTRDALDDFATLVRGDTLGLFLDGELALPAPLVQVDTAMILQMVHEGAAPAVDPEPILGPADNPSMIALAEATRPGPFARRTAELGTFYGARDHGRVIAMAGQRMRVPGMIEISAVCTDPDHLGRGHAARLMSAQLALIASWGKQAFLHVKADNARAIAIYERLGFRGTRTFRYVIVRAR